MKRPLLNLCLSALVVLSTAGPGFGGIHSSGQRGGGQRSAPQPNFGSRPFAGAPGPSAPRPQFSAPRQNFAAPAPRAFAPRTQFAMPAPRQQFAAPTVRPGASAPMTARPRIGIPVGQNRSSSGPLRLAPDRPFDRSQVDIRSSRPSGGGSRGSFSGSAPSGGAVQRGGGVSRPSFNSSMPPASPSPAVAPMAQNGSSSGPLRLAPDRPFDRPQVDIRSSGGGRGGRRRPRRFQWRCSFRRRLPPRRRVKPHL